MLLDWWKSNFKKKGKFKKKNERGEKMNGRCEKINKRASFMSEIEKMRREFQMNTNPPSYPPRHYMPQSGNESCTILKDLSEIPEVIMFNICTHAYRYTHIYTYTLTCLFVMHITWLSRGGFILVDLVIEYCNAPILRVRRRYCNAYTQVRTTLTYIR